MDFGSVPKSIAIVIVWLEREALGSRNIIYVFHSFILGSDRPESIPQPASLSFNRLELELEGERAIVDQHSRVQWEIIF